MDTTEPSSTPSLRENISHLLQLQHKNCEHFFDRVDLDQMVDLVQTLMTITGKIWVTGVGKSSLVARYLGNMLVSFGFSAYFMDPLNALHGDIGCAASQDAIIMFSKSGESDELMSLVPFLHGRGVITVAMVSNVNSKMARACRKTVCVPLLKEACTFGMAPVTSPALQIMFGGVIAAACMHAKGLTLQQYQLNHPQGRIGKRLTLRVKDLMEGDKSKLPCCLPESKFLDALLLSSKCGFGCIIVVSSLETNTFVGLCTDGDLRRLLNQHGEKVLQASLEEILAMRKQTMPDGVPPCRSVYSTDAAIDGMGVLETPRLVNVVPVFEPDTQNVVGVLTYNKCVSAGL